MVTATYPIMGAVYQHHGGTNIMTQQSSFILDDVPAFKNMEHPDIFSDALAIDP